MHLIGHYGRICVFGLAPPELQKTQETLSGSPIFRQVTPSITVTLIQRKTLPRGLEGTCVSPEKKIQICSTE